VLCRPSGRRPLRSLPTWVSPLMRNLEPRIPIACLPCHGGRAMVDGRFG
jgi:hypothetical protein